MYQERFYREWTKDTDLYKYWIVIKETDMLVCTSRKLSEEFIKEIVKKYRTQIEEYVKTYEEFQTSLSPVKIEEDAPPIIEELGKYSHRLGIGPFAGVAGAIAQFVGEELMKVSPEVIVENGGDLFLKLEKIRKVGVVFYEPGRENILRIKIKPQNTPLGISSSSSKIGHSLSLGNVDLSCILARNSILSDMCATLLGNIIKTKKDVPSAFKFIKKIEGVKGALVIVEGEISVWGDVEFV